MPVVGSDSAAYELLEELRWGGAPGCCPLCGTAGRCYYLSPAQGDSRPTRTGVPTERRVWKCGACRRQFSVLAGTILQGTRIAVHTWIAVVQDRAVTAPAASAAEVADRYGLSRDAARHLTRRLDLAAPAGEPELSWRDLLSALLHIPAEDAARIRDLTQPRVRPRPQLGPSADYGDG